MTMRALPVLFVALSLASMSMAQTPADVLRAEPKTYTISELPDDFRAVTIGGGDISPWMLFGMRGGSSSDTRAAEHMLIRSLSAAWVQPDEFAELLDGRRPRIRGFRVDIGALAGSSSVPTPVFTETWLEAGRIVSWSAAPELSKAALLKAFGGSGAPGSSVSADAAQRLSYIKQAATATMIFLADYDDIFPKADSSAKFYELVMPYLKNRQIVAASPESGRILYNTHLSGVNAAHTILLWEERPWSDGKRAVAFTDSHAKRVDDTEWNRLWAAELVRRAKSRRDR